MEDQATVKETVESLNRLGYPVLIVRPDLEPAMLASHDAVIRELQERSGVRAIAQAPSKYDSASADMLENAIKEKVRTLAHATRELHGVIKDPEHVALAWCVRFAGQIISRTVKGADGLIAFPRAFFARLTHEPCLQHEENRSCSWKRARRRFRSQTSFQTASSWTSRKVPMSSVSEHLLVGCLVRRTAERRPREDAVDRVLFQQHPWNTERIVVR